MASPLPQIKLGFIPANRSFFSSQLTAKMRDEETIRALKQLGSAWTALMSRHQR